MAGRPRDCAGSTPSAQLTGGQNSGQLPAVGLQPFQDRIGDVLLAIVDRQRVAAMLELPLVR